VAEAVLIAALFAIHPTGALCSPNGACRSRAADYQAGPPVAGRAAKEPSVLIKNGPHLKQAREALGWNAAELARALRLAGGPDQGEKRVLEMEAGRRQISGPVAVAVESFLHGFKPLGFKEDRETG
jgi:hypothetical protein